VHTGTADGGHYYSFIRDRLNRNELGQDQWYVPNYSSRLFQFMISVKT
jgi:ubiquitin carboxyl-terminal hydrolase 34